MNNYPFPGTGPFIQSFYIYRSNGTNPFIVIDSIPASALSYTDVNPLQGIILYQVVMRKTGSCDVILRMNSYSESRSNILNSIFTGIDEPVNNNFFTIYPNPATSSFTINIDKPSCLNIFSIENKLCYHNDFIRS